MFKQYHRDQAMLIPPTYIELIDPKDLLFSVVDVMECLDYTPFIARYDRNGQHAYNPMMMLTLLVYSYSIGIFSSRKMADRLQHDVRFRYLSGNQQPDFRTICEFRKNHLDLIRKYFVEIVQLCIAAGLTKTQILGVDGSKLHASTSPKQTKERHTLDRELAKLQERIDQLLDIAELTDEEEEQAENVPSKLVESQLRRQRLLEAKRLLDADKARKKVNLTDPDCREQHSVGPGYNAQIVVTGDNQMIVAADVVIDRSDAGCLLPMIAQAESNTDSVGVEKQVVADAGYESGSNLYHLEQSPHLDGYIASQRQDLSKKFPTTPYSKTGFVYDPENESCTCPQGYPMSVKTRRINKGVSYVKFIGTACPHCPVRSQCTRAKRRTVEFSNADPAQSRMRAKMETDTAKKAMRRRAFTVEPVFGHLKQNLGFRRFHLRGLTQVKDEFLLLCTAFNITKIHRLLNGSTLSSRLGFAY